MNFDFLFSCWIILVYIIFPYLRIEGNPEPVMNELIREAADFYMNVYPQLTHGVEYKKIGIVHLCYVNPLIWFFLINTLKINL